MTGEQAGNILALLLAAYPDTALDNESSSFFVSEIARLADYQAALEAFRLTARESKRFPSLAEFRQTYRTRVEARRPMRELEEAAGPRELPDEARALLGRLTVKDIAPPKLPSVEGGVCDDCKSAGERVSYGKKKVCEACARSRAVAAVQVEAWRYQAELEKESA